MATPQTKFTKNSQELKKKNQLLYHTGTVMALVLRHEDCHHQNLRAPMSSRRLEGRHHTPLSSKVASQWATLSPAALTAICPYFFVA